MLKYWCICLYVDVSENSGTPKSSILIGFSITNHPFWGIPIFGNTHVCTVHFGFAWFIITLCPESLANCWQKCRNVSRLNDWVDHAPQKRSCFQVVVTRGKKVCIWSFPGLHHVLAQRRALRWFLGVGFFLNGHSFLPISDLSGASSAKKKHTTVISRGLQLLLWLLCYQGANQRELREWRNDLSRLGSDRI